MVFISLQYRYHFLRQKQDMRTHSLDLHKGYKVRPNRNLHECKSRKFRTRISQIIVLYPYQPVFNLQRIPSSENSSLIRPLIRLGFDELLIEDIVPRDTIVHAFRF